MHHIMTPEIWQSSPQLKTMYTQMIKNVEIKESSIAGAGLGVFAKKNIKSGTIVSFYPAHALGIDDGDTPSFVCLPRDDDYFQSHPSTESSYLHCTDQPLFQRKSLLQQQASSLSLSDAEIPPLFLDANPNNRGDNDLCWVSHMINDGAKVESNTARGVLNYYEQTALQKNCIHLPFGPSPVMATVTTKKVKKGAELFTSYGGVYWLGVLYADHDLQVDMTPEIQTKIQQTARDLQQSMQTVSVTYAPQATALQEAFDAVHNEQSRISSASSS